MAEADIAKILNQFLTKVQDSKQSIVREYITEGEMKADTDKIKEILDLSESKTYDLAVNLMMYLSEMIGIETFQQYLFDDIVDNDVSNLKLLTKHIDKIVFTKLETRLPSHFDIRNYRIEWIGSQ